MGETQTRDSDSKFTYSATYHDTITVVAPVLAPLPFFPNYYLYVSLHPFPISQKYLSMLSHKVALLSSTCAPLLTFHLPPPPPTPDSQNPPPLFKQRPSVGFFKKVREIYEVQNGLDLGKTGA